MAKEAAPQSAPLSHFFVTVTGQIESGDVRQLPLLRSPALPL